MPKEFFLLGNIFILILISCFINIILLKKFKIYNYMQNLLFGLELTLIGVILYYINTGYLHYSFFFNTIINFITTYLLTTGFTLTLIGYLSKSNEI